MPIYEYECPACGTAFNELMPIDATAPPPCPRCGSTAARKRLSRFAAKPRLDWVGRAEDQRQSALDARAASVDRDDRRDIARFFQETGGGGWMDDEAFREVVDRAATGATDADMEDITPAVPVFGREEALAYHANQHAAPAPLSASPQATDAGGKHAHGPRTGPDD